MQHTPVNIFVSYAPEDERFLRELETHLTSLIRRGLISIWHNRMIMLGVDWTVEKDTYLNNASIILLLISPDFLASGYCYGIEMRQALQRHEQGEAHVIPILMRPCDLRGAPFAHLQRLPQDGKAVSLWANQDTAFVNIVQGISHVIDESQKFSSVHLTPRLSSVDQRNRQILLRQVRKFWIEGMLEQSLHQATFIAPHLQEQPDAVDNPWQRLLIQEINRSSHALPAGTSIVEVYDKNDGNLLILGQPGAGKTTLLLELARNLVNHAESNKDHPIPIILSLSSWPQKRQPLADWLVEDLSSKYQVPHKVSKDWIDADQIILLLDGLDQLAIGARQRCVDAINSYRQYHPLTPLIVCCRSGEYQSMIKRLSLSMAIMVQPYKIKEEWIKDGDDHSAAQRYNEALTAYDHALHLDENDDFLYYQKGCILASLERYNEAISAFDQAIRLSPRFASAYLSKGKALQQLSRSEEALQTFLRARELGYSG